MIEFLLRFFSPYRLMPFTPCRVFEAPAFEYIPILFDVVLCSVFLLGQLEASRNCTSERGMGARIGQLNQKFLGGGTNLHKKKTGGAERAEL